MLQIMKFTDWQRSDTMFPQCYRLVGGLQTGTRDQNKVEMWGKVLEFEKKKINKSKKCSRFRRVWTGKQEETVLASTAACSYTAHVASLSLCLKPHLNKHRADRERDSEEEERKRGRERKKKKTAATSSEKK